MKFIGAGSTRPCSVAHCVDEIVRNGLGPIAGVALAVPQAAVMMINAMGKPRDRSRVTELAMILLSVCAVEPH
jgi:hypothetical protein